MTDKWWPRPDKSKALLITSGMFRDGSLARLAAVERTADSLRDRLRGPRIWGLAPLSCQVLDASKDKASPADVLTAVRTASQGVEDAFVLYFAGHGHDEGGRLWLPLYDSDVASTATMLAFETLVNEISGSARLKLVLLDCCHAGQAMKDLRMEQYLSGEESEGCYVIGACAGNQKAKSPEGHELTAFGEALISCLESGGAPGEEFWTPSRLLEGTAAWLKHHGFPAPVHNAAPSGQLPWVRNKAYKPSFTKAVFAPPAPAESSGEGSEAVGAPLHIGLEPAPAPTPFIGRDDLLKRAREEVRVGQVLPVVGQKRTGKSALLSHLLEGWDEVPELAKPPAILEIEPNPAAEKPLLEAISRALRQTLDDGDLRTTPEGRIEDFLEDLLPRLVNKYTLVLVIKASGIDLKNPGFRKELDDLLSHRVFKRAVVLLESLEPVDFDVQARWRRRRPLVVRELETAAAKQLIGVFLAAENLRTDVDGIRTLDYEDIARGPGVIEMAALHVAQNYHRRDDFDRFLAGDDFGEETQEWVDPETFSDALLQAALLTVVDALMRVWPKYPDAWSEGQSVLTMWALLDDFALGLGDLEKMGLCRQVLRVLFNEKVIVQSRGSDPADRLLEIGLAAREALKKDLLDKTSDFPDDADIVDGHLTDAVRLLVATVLPVVSTGGEAQLLAEIPPLLEALRRTTGWLDHNLGGALPGLRARCGDYVNGGFPDALVLPVGQRAVSAPEGAPVAGGPAPVGAAGPAGDLEELYAAAGRLNVASRAVPSERATETFVAEFERAALLMEACASDLPGNVLRAIDQCGFHGSHRHQAHQHVLSARTRLAERLTTEEDRPRRPDLLRSIWSISWILNTATAQITVDDRSGVQRYLDDVERMIGALPEARDPRNRQTHNWLSYRLARLRCDAATTAEERLAAQKTAYGLAEENVRFSVELPERQYQWTSNLLVCSFYYALEIRDDEVRLNLARRTFATLEKAWGPRSQWPLFLTARAAYFLRNVHERHADSQAQFQGAREVLDLLRSRAAGFDGQGLLSWQSDYLIELAKCHAFQAHTLRERNERSAVRASLEESIRTAKRAVTRFPGVYTYKVWLKVLSTKQAWYGDSPGRPLLPEYAEAVAQVRAWLDEQGESRCGDQDMALLDLWCIDGDWRRKGSLLVAARAIPVPAQVARGRILVSAEQWRVDKVYKQRQNALTAHEKHYGSSWSHCEARFRLLREYQRLSAIYGKHPLDVDHTPVWELLNEAARNFPGSLEVLRTRARYNRYIWRYREAACQFEEVARRERNGDKFRTDLIDAAECLLSQALYDEELSAESKHSVLSTASGLLEEVAGCHVQAHEVILLKARVDLELGNPVDWRLADAKRIDLIGDNYVKGVGELLNDPHRRHSTDQTRGASAEGGGMPHAMDDLLEENFTDIQVLKQLGLLYYRCSVLEHAKGEAEAALNSAWRAYNCFDGARVMEEGGHNDWGEEWADTAFLRGQVITWAGELTSSPSPFPRESEDHKGWIGLAYSRLQSARDRSAGDFHRLVKSWEERLVKQSSFWSSSSS
ncbi:caspase family protein [Streptomyces caelestis]